MGLFFPILTFLYNFEILESKYFFRDKLIKIFISFIIIFFIVFILAIHVD